jgi:hypothetical protein
MLITDSQGLMPLDDGDLNNASVSHVSYCVLCYVVLNLCEKIQSCW